MITLQELLSENERNRVKALVRIHYSESASTMDVAEILRAIKDVTIVSTHSTAEEGNIATYDVKMYTTMSPKKAYGFVRRQALLFSEIDKVEIATASIETY